MVARAPIGLRTNAAFEQSCDLCRQLERELNAANERIKRLEEAGDELLDWIGSDVSDANRKLIIDSWRNAKEAKP
jgi:hypothetical protein